MKKNIIVLGTALILLCLLIFSFTNWDSDKANKVKSIDNKNLALEKKDSDELKSNTIPELHYGVDTQFAAVRMLDVHKATTIYDFLDEGEKEQIEQINSVEIIVIKDHQQSNIRAIGTSAKFTDAQLEILKSTTYFSGFTVRTEFKEKDTETGELKERFFGPHITVVPETLAAYSNGKEALLAYLRENSKENMYIIKDEKLGALKLSFTITKDGKVSNVMHDAMTTGYPSIDEKLIELIQNMPGEWTPARNSKGEKMEQKLVFTFGPADGC